MAALLVGALVAYETACGDTAAFACQSDTDCVLSGLPGVCDGNGRCAYPDADCPSGFSYPVATPGLAGECVPGGAATGSSDGGGSGHWGSGNDAGTTLMLDGTGASDTTTSGSVGSGADSSSTTGALTAADSSSDDAGVDCGDEHGDQIFTGTVIGGCQAEVVSEIQSVGDLDWFALFASEGCAAGLYEADLEQAGDSLIVCIVAGCEDASGSNAQCEGSLHTVVSGYQACCSPETARGVLSCGMSGAIDPFLVVGPHSRMLPDTCVPYSFTFSSSPA